MKRAICSLAMLCVMAMPAAMLAQSKAAKSKPAEKKAAAPAAEKFTVTQLADRAVTGIEKLFVNAADAMPEDKYDFVPTAGEFKGVRSFAGQVKHVAQTNFMIASALSGEKRPEGADDDATLEKMTSKADIMKYLKDSYAAMHKAYATLNGKNLTEMIQSPFGKNKVARMSLAWSGVSHTNDHYGQMVEYLRMNGIIPPASRG